MMFDSMLSKKCCAALLVLMFILCSCTPAFAVTDSDYAVLQSQYTNLQSQYNSLNQSYTVLQEDNEELQEQYTQLQEQFTAAQTQGFMITGLDDGEDAPSESMSGIVATLFGTYSPRTQTVTQTLENGSTVTSQEIIPGVAGMDWHWIAGVVLFTVCLWSFFRFLGVIFKHG